jgi:hypothetical protein
MATGSYEHQYSEAELSMDSGEWLLYFGKTLNVLWCVEVFVYKSRISALAHLSFLYKGPAINAACTVSPID